MTVSQLPTMCNTKIENWKFQAWKQGGHLPPSRRVNLQDAACLQLCCFGGAFNTLSLSFVFVICVSLSLSLSTSKMQPASSCAALEVLSILCLCHLCVSLSFVSLSFVCVICVCLCLCLYQPPRCSLRPAALLWKCCLPENFCGICFFILRLSFGGKSISNYSNIQHIALDMASQHE